jgi:hypothetical protein
MPACPNCGRSTLRTRDWACQWCGYPLLSRAYKKIDKTYKELQEERFPGLKTLSPGPEPYSESVAQVSPPEPALKPPPRFEEKVQPTPPPENRPRPAAVRPEPALKPEAELPPPPAPVFITPPPPAMVVTPPPAPAPPPEPEPAPVAPPRLESVIDGAVLTVDELDALYKSDRLAAHARLAGKTILIKGFVEKVFIRDHIDVRYIVLTGARKKAVWPVRCTFGRENISQMERLGEGQEVTLRGRYDSYGKNIIFKDSVLA